ncbi:MAG: MEDS domain-containing protein [Thermodesulfobacteriota bacterium]
MEKTKREISLGLSSERFKEGQHIIYIYNDDYERKRTMAKYLQQGVLEKEKILYLVDDISPDEMRKELSALGVDIDENQKNFDITKAHYACCPGNYFSKDFMLGIVGEYYDNAIKEGHSGARGAGEMSWAVIEGHADIYELLEYESALNHILKRHPLTTVCQYDARKFMGDVLMDILSVHPMMIVRGQMVKNPGYIEPDTFIKEYKDRIERKNAGFH